MHKALEVDWIAIKNDRAKGVSFRELSERYGGTETALRQRARREGWNLPGVRQAGSVMDRVVPKGTVLKRLQENVALKAESTFAKAIERLVTKSVTQAEQIMDRSHSALMAAESTKDLFNAAKSWEVGHNGARRALGLDRPDGSQTAPAWSGQVSDSPVIDVESVANASDAASAPSTTPDNAPQA